VSIDPEGSFVLEGIKKLLRDTPLYAPYRVWAVKRAQQGSVERWIAQGRPSPPPHLVKQRVLLEIAETYRTKTLVETGTYYGDMVAAMMPHFERIYSIELSDDLFAKAVKRFRHDPQVVLVHGDSGSAIEGIVASLDAPALFWLDGHYSGGETARGNLDTPVLAELAHVLAASLPHPIVIDDARLFGTDPNYPDLEHVVAFVADRAPERTVAVDTDSIRILPPLGPSGRS
jgi:hypothetical protein